MKKVEQINNKGEVVFDYDEIINSSDFKYYFSPSFNFLNDKNPFEVEFKNKKYIFCIKSITYLGNPHPLYKKRIQIPKEWRNTLKKENTILIGIYKYKDNVVFTIFDLENYKNNRLNNSSAHVNTLDIRYAVENDFFSKLDIRGNKIYLFTKENFEKGFEEYIKNRSVTNIAEINLFDEFADKLDKKWNGKECYKEMIDNNYTNAFQSEWAGFYLEYKFEMFLEEDKQRKTICLFVRDKKINGHDLDLNFHDEFLGDLKTHSVDSSAVLGNDMNVVDKVLDKYNKLWYVIFEHDTIKDNTKDYEVTTYWNQKINCLKEKKKPLDSYGSRMKNSIEIKKMIIAEINKYNKKYLSVFNQGLNSNGKPREPKIKINNKALDNFVIHRKLF
jgi:hypothetical protein